jgi:hypothetical protein
MRERIKYTVVYQSTDKDNPEDYQFRDVARVEGTMDPVTTTRAGASSRLAASVDAVILMAGKDWTGPQRHATVPGLVTVLTGAEDK